MLEYSLYDTKSNNSYLEEIGYSTIIAPNVRNTKDESKLLKKN